MKNHKMVVSAKSIPSNKAISEKVANILLTITEANEGRYGKAWTRRDDAEDVEHIFDHLSNYLTGDKSDTHLENSLTRLAFLIIRRDLRSGENQQQLLQ